MEDLRRQNWTQFVFKKLLIQPFHHYDCFVHDKSMDRFEKLSLNYGRDTDSDSEDEDQFNFPAVAPSFNYDLKQEQEPPKKASVYAFEQPLAVPFVPGKHRGVLVNRPQENGGPKVIENDNAFPDGVFAEAKV